MGTKIPSSKAPPLRTKNPHAIVNRVRSENEAVNIIMTKMESDYATLFTKYAELLTLNMSDDLTKLLNREGFQQTVALAETQNISLLQSGNLPARAIAVLFIDLDNFKEANDTFGHEAGDDILKAAATAMKRAKFPNMKFICGRQGGDEMVIAISGDKQALQENLEVIANGVRESIKQGCRITPGGKLSDKGNTLITASIGASLSDNDVTHAMTEADSAMYMSKRAGRDRVTLYVPEHADVQRRAMPRGVTTPQPTA